MRDAEEVDIGPAFKRRYKVRPKHAEIRIRLAGAWRDAHLHHWQRDGERWLAWVEYDDLDGQPWPKLGMFVYDGETIVPRHDDARPS